MALRPDADDAALRSYLLGLLSEAEAAALEEAYFARAEVLERLHGVEDDLLDDYAAGRLDTGDKLALERRYLASVPLRERVAAARALRRAVTQEGPASKGTVRPSRWRIPLGIAAGFLLVFLAVLLPRRPPASTTADSPVGTPPTMLAPSGAAVVPSPASSATIPARDPGPVRLVVLALSPVLLRGESRPVPLRIPQGTESIEIELEGDRSLVPPSASALKARLETLEGREIWRGAAGRAEVGRRSVVATARVPAAMLASDDYILTLSAPGGSDEILHRYFFRVTR